MSDLSSLPPLRDVISAHGLRAEKKLGQNFLLDLNITDKIARAAPIKTGMTVFEIGPGPGGLTRSLLKTEAAKVVAIEYDPRAIVALQDLVVVSEGRLTVHHADALDTDLCALEKAFPRAIVANLPYNIATPLLIGWLRQIRADDDAFSSMTLMFQKEVADRQVAVPETKSYGRLSVITQWLCDVRIVFDLPPSAFTPAPKVKSSVVTFLPRPLSNDDPAFEAMEKITALAFNQRRKMLRSSLKPYLSVLEALGIDTTKRAEALTVADFVYIAKEAERQRLL